MCTRQEGICGRKLCSRDASSRSWRIQSLGAQGRKSGARAGMILVLFHFGWNLQAHEMGKKITVNVFCSTQLVFCAVCFVICNLWGMLAMVMAKFSLSGWHNCGPQLLMCNYRTMQSARQPGCHFEPAENTKFLSHARMRVLLLICMHICIFMFPGCCMCIDGRNWECETVIGLG